MRSRLIVGLPRSLTTAVFGLTRDALKLTEPAWVTHGEILNPDRYRHGCGANRTHHLTRDTTPQRFVETLEFLDLVIEPDDHVYKDVLQPFVIAEYARATEIPIICIRRPIPDVALHMIRQGWAELDDDELIPRLERAQAELDTIAHAEFIDFDELIMDEARLRDVLGVDVRYISETFVRQRDRVLSLRTTPEHGRLRARSACRERSSMPARVGPPRDPTTSVVMVSDALCPTGFSRVGHEILRALAPTFAVSQVGINYFGVPHDLPWQVHPASVGARNVDVTLRELVECRPPGAMILLNDPWVVAGQARELRAAGYGGRLVGYCPVDATPLSTSIAAGLSALDQLVAYTEFGRTAFATLFIDSGFAAPPMQVIHHGVDTHEFRLDVPDDPKASRLQAKARLFPPETRFLDSFVVLNANRNQPRKRIDLTIRAFAAFAADKPDNVHLYLHMARTDQGWDVIELAERFGITDRLIMSTDTDALPTLATGQLKDMYNACDIGLNTTAAEGWGLVAFEHAACGGAQVMPAIGPLLELWDDAAELLPTTAVTTPAGHVADWHLLDSDTVAAALQRLYANPSRTQELARRGLGLVTESRFAWRTIGQQWIELLTSAPLREGRP